MYLCSSVSSSRYNRLFACCYFIIFYELGKISNSYTMGCQPVRKIIHKLLESGLSYVQVDNMV